MRPVADDEIFREVNDDLRLEQIRTQARRFAGAGVAVVLLGLAGFGAWEYHLSSAQKQAEQNSAVYFRGLHDAGTDSTASGEAAPLTDEQKKALASLGDLSHTAPASLAALTKLRVAAADASHGRLPQALEAWNSIQQDMRVAGPLRNVATLLWCQWQADTGDIATLRSRLTLLSGAGKPFGALADELQATLDLRAGQEKQARDRLTKLSQDYTAPDGVRMRAGALLRTLSQPG